MLALERDVDGRMVDIIGTASELYATDLLDLDALFRLLRAAYAKGYTDRALDGGNLETDHGYKRTEEEAGMRRVIETLYGYRFEYSEVDVPMQRDGQLVHLGNGDPRYERKRSLAFVNEEEQHTVVIPLTEEGKLELLAAMAGSLEDAQKRQLAGQLTGGIVIP